MFNNLMHIKQTPINMLPSVETMLAATLEITQIKPLQLLDELKNPQCDNDVFLKMVVFCDSLNVEDFKAYALQIRQIVNGHSGHILPPYFDSYTHHSIQLFAK